MNAKYPHSSFTGQPYKRVFKYGFTKWLLALASVLLLSMPFHCVLAQATGGGTITGHVIDPSGDVVGGARITITDEGTGVSISLGSNSAGLYSRGPLKPGVYSVSASAKGFNTEIRRGLTLQVAQVLEEDFKLEVGNVSQTVSVSGGTPLLNTETADVGNVIPHTPIIELPLNGRNFTQLALLVPGTNNGEINGVRQTGSGSESMRAGASVVADGARADFNTYLIDGLNDDDQLVGVIKVFPNLEDIQEFKVQIGNYNAEFMSGGAVVNVTTMSGTSQFHGAAFDFFRNSATDTRQYFDAPNVIPPYKQNQFGVALGGPIRKNKLFFFADYQGLRVAQAFTAILSEPTTALRTGDFSSWPSTIYDPATYNPITNTRQPFTNNVIPADRINPIAKNLLTIMALPNLPGLFNNLRTNSQESDVQNQFDVRIDATLSAKDSIFGRYTYGTSSVTYPGVPPEIDGTLNPLAFSSVSIFGQLQNNYDPSQQATLQEAHTFSSEMTNQAIFGYTREALNVADLDAGLNASARLGLNGSDSPGQGNTIASLSFPTYAGTGSSYSPEIIPQNTEEYSDTITLVRGLHVMDIGGDVIHNNFGFLQLPDEAGALSFTGNFTNDPANSNSSGSGVADFLLGLPSTSDKSSVPFGPPVVSYNEISAFVQDTWRATSRLTLTPGLRWDWFTDPVERKNRESDFVPGPNGLIGENNSGESVALAGQGGYSAGIVHTQAKNFSPRVGAAYRLGGKTVLRGAYGLFYFDEQGTGGSYRLFSNYPDITSNAVNCTNITPCMNLSDGIPNTSSAGVLPNVIYQPIDNPASWVQEWNVTVERQLSNTVAATASYVGNHGSNLHIAFNADTAYPGPGPIAPRQPYSNFSSISAWEPIGVSNYNALQLSLNKRMGGGLYFLAAYTYSRSLDEGAGGNSSDSESRQNLQNPRDIRANYGLSDFNFSQRVTFSPVYQLPFGHGQHFLSNASGITEEALGGWQATGILTLQSGAPFSVEMGTSLANTGTFTRPNRICNGNLPTGQRDLQSWFDTDCFVSPPSYQFGNTGRNILIGPGFADFDFGLGKDFRIHEGLGMQFRAEAFNLPNHPSFDIPASDIGAPGAGTISAQFGNARQMQFVARFHW